MKYPLYNKSLCPLLWDKKEDQFVLKPEIRERLMQIATDLIKEKFEDVDVKIKPVDIVLVGSSTNYNWTPYSDLDIHIVVDPKDLSMTEEEARAMFDSVRANWNKTHNISIKGHDLEVSFEFVGDENSVTSIYSLQNNKWVQPPTFERPTFNKEVIKKKHKELKAKIEQALSSKNEESIRLALEKLYAFRQAGLDKSGEFSEENIVFKILRAQGYVDKLKQCASSLYDKEMTLMEASMNEIALNNPHLQTYRIAVKYIAELINRYVDKHGRYPVTYPRMLKQIADRYEKSPQEVYRHIFDTMEALRKQKS